MHQLSSDDIAFVLGFEAGRLRPADFDHRAHVRLAYALLVGNEPERAASRMRELLLGFLADHGIDTARYHETMTRAWVDAVRHFMDRTPESASADAFIDANPELLDSRIMLTHYSAAVLFSPEARQRYVDPDVQAIPRSRR